MLLYHSVLVHHALMLRALREAVLFAPCLAFSYYLVAAGCAILFSRRRSAAPPEFAPPISILKPVRGIDRDAYENFARFCRLDYPQYEILFGVADSGDPVVPLIQRLMADFPGCPIRLFTPVSAQYGNEKTSILAWLASEAQFDLLVISDSDTRVAPDCLRAIAAPFADTRVGAASSLYRAESPQTLADALEAVGISTEFAAGVLVAERFAEVRFALGALMAVRRARLEQIGGFEALSDFLMDDYELGRRIAEAGSRVTLTASSVAIVPPAGTVRDYWRRQLRWAVGVRNSRPWGHLGLFITQGLPLTLAAALVSRSGREAALYLSAYLMARYAMAWAAGWITLRDRVLISKWWLIPVRDALAFSWWLASFFCRRVTWRGSAFSVRKGRLSAV